MRILSARVAALKSEADRKEATLGSVLQRLEASANQNPMKRVMMEVDVQVARSRWEESVAAHAELRTLLDSLS